MKAVIQCAAGKNRPVGDFAVGGGRPVMFVAHPGIAPDNRTVLYRRPDDPAGSGLSYRQVLVAYHREPAGNRPGLLPAWKLYRHPVYGELVDTFGIRNVFILSAGWGLIAADFLTPDYDITFSSSAEPYKRRRRRDRYHDLQMLPQDSPGPIVFLGGKDYIPLFVSLTKGMAAERIVFYNSDTPPDAPGCTLRRFVTRTRTNWHYECARALMRGEITV